MPFSIVCFYCVVCQSVFIKDDKAKLQYIFMLKSNCKDKYVSLRYTYFEYFKHTNSRYVHMNPMHMCRYDIVICFNQAFPVQPKNVSEAWHCVLPLRDVSFHNGIVTFWKIPFGTSIRNCETTCQMECRILIFRYNHLWCKKLEAIKFVFAQTASYRISCQAFPLQLRPKESHQYLNCML